MKTFLTILFGFSFLYSKAQTDTIPQINGEYEYTGIVQLDTSFKKDDIYKSAKVYFVDNFKSANDVIQYQDPKEGKIIGKGFFELHETKWLTNVLWQVYYTTSIECKDGKYRYRIYNINIKEDWYGTSSSVKKDLSVEQAIAETKKGQLKKQATSMFNSMASNLSHTPDIIKNYIIKNKTISKTDF